MLKGKRSAIPIDALLVYDVTNDGNIEGGSGEDLAHQVVNVVRVDLEMETDELSFIRCKNNYNILIQFSEVA